MGVWSDLSIKPYLNILSAKILKYGGATRDRTADLLNANQALSQLSYSPNFAKQNCHNIKPSAQMSW